MQRRRPYLLHEAAKTTSLAKGVDNMKRHTKEELTLWCESKDEPVPGSMARRANKAGSVYDVSELMKSDQLNPWTMAKLKESYLEARHGKDQRKCIVQQVIQRNTNILQIIAPVQRQGGVTLSYVCLQCHRFPIEDCIWLVWTGLGDSSKKDAASC